MHRARVPVTALALTTCLALAGPARAQALFQEHTELFPSPQPCFDVNDPDAEGCYTHYVLMVDINKDGALDLLFAGGGGYYTPSTTAPFLIYLNDGTGQMTRFVDGPIGAFQGRVRQIAVGDVDGDGDLDIYVPQGYGQQPDNTKDAFFINDGQNPPHFTDESLTRLGIVSRAGAVRFGDVDGDGDLDLVISDWGDAPPGSAGTAHVYLNNGTGNFTEKANAVPAMPQNPGTGPIDMDLFDADGDFDLDLLLASRTGGGAHLFRNDGAGAFTEVTMFPPQLGPYTYGPAACDVDGDGDIDLWLDNEGPSANNNTQLLTNDGMGAFTDVTTTQVTPGNGPADDNSVTCVDIDGDGDLDIVIASLTTPERVLLNTSGSFAIRPSSFPSVIDATLGLDMGDLNGDKILDVVTAQGEAGSFLNRIYLGDPNSGVMKPDTIPPKIRATEVLPPSLAAGNVGIRFSVSDSVVTDTGPRLKQAYMDVDGTFIPARFMGGDIFRALVTIGEGKTINYRGCAEDLAGNKACGPMMTFTQGNGMPASSSSASSGGMGGAGGTGGGGTGGGGDSGGCGCAVPGEAGAPLGLLSMAALALAALRRRRR